jgi:hypothetical protein
MILRKPYPGKPKWSEYIFQGLVFIFFLMSILSMPFFNPTIRDYIFVEFKFRNTKLNYILISMFPFILGILFCTFIPSVVVIWNFMGCTVYNFNGYMVPLILKMNHQKQNSKPYRRYGFGVFLCVFSMLFYVVYNVYELIKKYG